MKITDYNCYTLSTGWRNLTYCVIETDEGIRGWGEAHIVGKTHTVQEYLKDVKRHIIGHEVSDFSRLNTKFTLLDFGAPGQVTMTGLSLIDMACWDAWGKKLGLPVYRLLGGVAQSKIPAYANGWYTVERTPEEFHAAADRVVKKGYRALKFDPFGNGNLELTREEYRHSLELVEAVFDATKDKAQMLIEMHGRMSPSQAVEICRELEKYHVGFVEEPVRPLDMGALKYVTSHTCVPVAAGERWYTSTEYNRAFAERLIHVAQPDVSQCGGITEVKKISEAAEMFSIMAAPHNVGGAVATAANIHLMAGLKNTRMLEHFNDFSDSWVKKAVKNYPEVVDGYFTLPETPGLGVEVDEDFLREHQEVYKEGVILDPGLNMYECETWNKRSSK